MTAQLVLEAMVLLGVLAVVAALAAGFGDVLVPSWRDSAPLPLPPARRLGSDDLAGARFSVAFRGYRMAEVDLLMDRLAGELADRDEELAELRAALAPSGPPEPGAVPDPLAVPPDPDDPDPDVPVIPGRADPLLPDVGQPRPDRIDRP